MSTSYPTEEEWQGYFDQLSNWGKWGPDDDRGTLNYITPQVVSAAAGLVREGVTVSLARDIDFSSSRKEDPDRALHFMGRTGVVAPEKGFAGAHDWTVLPLHGLTLTHLDAHSHMIRDGKLYNGQDARRVTAEQGARVGSLKPTHDGIVSRGVFLDIAELKGLPWLEESYEITPDDLDAAAERQGVEMGSGDIVMVRTGYGLRRRTDLLSGDNQEPKDFHPLLPGLGVGCLPWMHEHEVAVVGTDTGTETRPSRFSWLAPFHAVALVSMGLWILDNFELEPIKAATERFNRSTFLTTIATLRLKNSTGCPVNPIAVF